MISPALFRAHLGQVIRGLFLGVVLLGVSSVADQIPGSDADLVSGLPLAAAARLVIAAVLIAITVQTTPAAGTVLAFLGTAKLAPRSGSSTILWSVGGVARQVAQLIALAAGWFIIRAALPILLGLSWLADYQWLPNVVTFAFLAAVAVIGWNLYSAAQPLFDFLSVSLSDRVVGAGGQRCAACGADNPLSAGFCGTCGAAMLPPPPPPTVAPAVYTPVAPTAAAPVPVAPVPPRATAPASPPLPATVRCPSCGDQNPSDSRFCGSCGATIVQPNPA